MVKKVLWAAGLWAGLSAAWPSETHACGGCFAPPTVVQVVTDHRIVLSLSTTRTTLWDQFRYTGRPSDFSWILPIRNGPQVTVREASNDFMVWADASTAPQIFVPRAPTQSCGSGLRLAAGDFSNAEGPGNVVVHRQEVVGPYVVTVLGGSDPMAIREWLRTNGYSIPPSVEPIIDFYTEMRMDYVALRLNAGEGIDRMSPIRVTMPGYVPSLPLRMIAAGIADKVGLSLVVLASSRVEAQNFPNGELEESDLRYDFRNPTDPAQDFLNAFNRRNAAAGGRLWLTESAESIPSARQQWEYGVQSFTGTRPASAPNPMDDVSVAFADLGSGPYITRLRADLATVALDRDLVLRASDLSTRRRFYNYGVVVNTPPVADCNLICAARPWASNRSGAGALLGLAGAVAAARRLRRRG